MRENDCATSPVLVTLLRRRMPSWTAPMCLTGTLAGLPSWARKAIVTTSPTYCHSCAFGDRMESLTLGVRDEFHDEETCSTDLCFAGLHDSCSGICLRPAQDERAGAASERSSASCECSGSYLGAEKFGSVDPAYDDAEPHDHAWPNDARPNNARRDGPLWHGNHGANRNQHSGAHKHDDKQPFWYHDEWPLGHEQPWKDCGHDGSAREHDCR